MNFVSILCKKCDEWCDMCGEEICCICKMKIEGAEVRACIWCIDIILPNILLVSRIIPLIKFFPKRKTQPFIPPKSWSGKFEKIAEQNQNLPKDEDAWELYE